MVYVLEVKVFFEDTTRSVLAIKLLADARTVCS